MLNKFNLKYIIFYIKKQFYQLFGFYLYGKKSFAQEGEDLIIFRLFGERSSGTYVDVGCHHPFRFSNTNLLYRAGWSGICVDPLPGIASKFRFWRPRDVVVEVGIAEECGVLHYFMFDEPALNTFDSALAASRPETYGCKLLQVKAIETKPLASILMQCKQRLIRGIDVLSVDAEGMDLEVLQSNDWESFQPKVIVVECLGYSIRSQHPHRIVDYLTQKGYEVYAKTGNSVIFKHTLLMEY